MKIQEFKKKKEKKKTRRSLGVTEITLNFPVSELKMCQKEKNSSKKLKTYLNK